MNELMKFDFDGRDLTAITDQNGNPWFVAKEVCGLLGYAKPQNAVAMHCKHPKILKGPEIGHLTSSPRGITIIPEPDLFRLITRSKLPAAERFEVWVYDEVLPEIRKTGAYIPATPADMTDAQLDIALEKITRLHNEKRALEQANDQKMRVIVEAAPMVKKYMSFMDSEETQLISDVAKAYNNANGEALKVAGEKLGEDPHVGSHKLCHYLKSQGILQKKFNNPPYQKYLNKGWFKVIETSQGYPQTKVTTKGVDKIMEMDPEEILATWKLKKELNNLMKV